MNMPATQQTHAHTDVIILGGGLVGLTQALALARHGLTVAVVEPVPAPEHLDAAFDGRASAVASASWKMLQAIGLGEMLEPLACPIYNIHVSDGLKPGTIDFESPKEEGPLGVMFENRVLREALHAAANGEPNITIHRPAKADHVDRGEHGVTAILSNGETLKASLLIAAEGRKSPTRDEEGLKSARWDYGHLGIVTGITHEKPHNGTAYEVFYSDGPFAILPMNDFADGRHRSAIVWSFPHDKGKAMLKLSDRAMAHEITKAMGGLLGTIEMAAPRSAYPLNFHHTARIIGQRLALVGDAAHGIHPIAGQGFNLGLRDVAALTEILVEGARTGLDVGDAQLLDRYESWRSLDSVMVAASTDALTRLFGIPGKTASAVRRFGMGLVQRTGPLKNYFMAEARGEAGKLPKLLMGDLV